MMDAATARFIATETMVRPPIAGLACWPGRPLPPSSWSISSIPRSRSSKEVRSPSRRCLLSDRAAHCRSGRLRCIPGRVLPWGGLLLGSYAEVILPLLIVVGLFTRLAALGMITFVLVQTYVDIAFHGVDDATIGAWFDNVSSAAVLDHDLIDVLFLFLILKGAGSISLDALFGRRFTN